MASTITFNLAEERFLFELSRLKSVDPLTHQALKLFFQNSTGADWPNFKQLCKWTPHQLHFDGSVEFGTFWAILDKIEIYAVAHGLNFGSEIITIVPVTFHQPKGLGSS